MDTTKRAVLSLLWLIFLGAGIFTLISHINEVQDQAAFSQAQPLCRHGDCNQMFQAQEAQADDYFHELIGEYVCIVTLLPILVTALVWAKDRRRRLQLSRLSSYRNQ
jgi:hypothetical protein